MIAATEELVEAVAKAMCKSLDPDPDEVIVDDRSGARHPRWMNYKDAANAAIDVVLSV